jgi:hypothetical protein
MPRMDLQHDLEPSARGRFAFWQGRTIADNPLTGAPAREWLAGWRRGLAELAACLPPDERDVQALPAAVQRRLLREHCPDDVPPLPPQHHGKGLRPAAGSRAGAQR